MHKNGGHSVLSCLSRVFSKFLKQRSHYANMHTAAGGPPLAGISTPLPFSLSNRGVCAEHTCTLSFVAEFSHNF